VIPVITTNRGPDRLHPAAHDGDQRQHHVAGRHYHRHRALVDAAIVVGADAQETDVWKQTGCREDYQTDREAIKEVAGPVSSPCW
jgi:hypothetical protein